MEVEGELGSDPLVSALPARPVQENVVAVLRHVFDQVVSKAQVCCRQAQDLAKLGVLDLDPGFFHLQHETHAQYLTLKSYFKPTVSKIKHFMHVGLTSTTASLRCLCWRKRMLVAPATKPRTVTSDRR